MKSIEIYKIMHPKLLEVISYCDYEDDEDPENGDLSNEF